MPKEELYQLFAYYLGVEAYVFDLASWIAGVLVGLVGVLFGLPLTLYLYNTKRHFDQITYSLNEFEEQVDGSILLKIRTQLILPTADLLPGNGWFKLKLFWKIRYCTADCPFVKMKLKDMDLLQPGIISGYSSLFAEGIAARAAKLPTHSKEFLLSVTVEPYPSAVSYKMRVMLITKEDLAKIQSDDFCSRLVYERAHHSCRLRTLRSLAREYEAELAKTKVDDVRFVRTVEAVFRA